MNVLKYKYSSRRAELVESNERKSNFEERGGSHVRRSNRTYRGFAVRYELYSKKNESLVDKIASHDPMNRPSRGRLSGPPAEIPRKVLGRLRTGGGQQINLHRYIQRIREFYASKLFLKLPPDSRNALYIFLE